MEFDCSECQTRLRVNDALAGRKARCPKCREVTEIPGGHAEPALEAAQGPATPTVCERCNRPILPNEITQQVDGKMHCSYCLTDLGIATDGSLQDPTGLGIPGMVILRGKEERDAARRYIDRQAEKEHKEATERRSPQGKSS